MILLLRTFSFKPHAMHQTLYFLVICPTTSVDKLMMDSPNTIAAFVMLIDLPDHSGCFFIPFSYSIFFRDLIVVGGSR